MEHPKGPNIAAKVARLPPLATMTIATNRLVGSLTVTQCLCAWLSLGSVSPYLCQPSGKLIIFSASFSCLAVGELGQQSTCSKSAGYECWWDMRWCVWSLRAMEEQAGSSGYSETSELITPNILRGLGDRSYDKRKASALELTAVIRTFQVCLSPPPCPPLSPSLLILS
jgi:hypothetical protein